MPIDDVKKTIQALEVTGVRQRLERVENLANSFPKIRGVRTINNSAPDDKGNFTLVPAITVKDEGTTLSTAVTSLDFVGAGVSATGTTDVTVTVTATPGGSDTQVQFNDGGAFGGDAGLTYNKTTDTLTTGDLTLTGGDLIASTATTFNVLNTVATTINAFGAATAINLGAASAAVTLAGGATINGGSAANDDLSIQGTSNSTRTTSYLNLQPNGGFVGVGTTTPLNLLTVAASGNGNYVRVGSNTGSGEDRHLLLGLQDNGGTSTPFISGRGFGTDAALAFNPSGGVIGFGTFPAGGVTNTFGTSGASVGIRLQVAAAYSGRYLDILDGTGTPVFIFSNSGYLGIGNNIASPGAMVDIRAYTSTKGLAVREAATTPGNIVEFQSSSGTAKIAVKPGGALSYMVQTELTIASGAVTATGTYHSIDTESDAASDDLDTISGGEEGDIIVIRANNSSRTVVVKHNTGNIQCGSDRTLDNANDTWTGIFDGTNWLQISFNDNGA